MCLDNSSCPDPALLANKACGVFSSALQPAFASDTFDVALFTVFVKSKSNPVNISIITPTEIITELVAPGNSRTFYIPATNRIDITPVETGESIAGTFAISTLKRILA